MPRRFRRAVALRSAAQKEETQQAGDESLRRKREYMRRWRSNPAHQAQERERRQTRYYDRKVRNLSDEVEIPTGVVPGDRCGFCHRLPSVTEVQRLAIRGSGRDGYVEIAVPYCGTC
jgi:hypothetical protein